MSEIDVTLVAIGGAIAAVVGTVVMNMLNKTEDDEEITKSVTTASKATKSSKKANKKTKKAAAKQPAAAPVAAKVEVVADDVVVVPTPSPPAPSSSSSSKKKKKKSKKDATPPAPEPAPEPSKKAAKKAKAKKAKAAEAAPVAKSTPRVSDDGWEVVQSSSSSSRSVPVKTTTEKGTTITKATIDVKGHKSAVIGAKGAVIQNIQAVSNAKLDIPKGDASVCTISGSEHDVSVALKMVQDIIRERDDYIASQVSKTVDVPVDRIPAIIGKGGATIKAIQSTSGVSIDIDKETSVVTIKGTAPSVENAERMIDEILNPPEPEYEATTTMDLSRHPMGPRAVYVIKGYKGQTIRAIEAETQAKLDIEKGSHVMSIKGTQEAVVQALTAVSRVLAENNHEVVIPIVDQKTVGAILGRGGSNIRMLEEKSKASLKLVDGQKLVIQGTKEQVAKAQELVTELLEGGPIKPTAGPGEVVAELACPASAIGSIIGKSGAEIKSLQESSGARVDVPRGLNICWIVGTPDAVKKAKKAVQEKIEACIKLEQEREERAKLAAANAQATKEAFADVSVSDNAGGDEWGGTPVDQSWGTSVATSSAEGW